MRSASDNLTRDIERLQQENARLTEQLVEQGRLQAQQMNAQSSELTSSIQEQGSKLGQQLQELDSRHGAQLRQLDERLTANVKDLEKRHNGRLQDLDTKYAHRGDELQRSLREAEESIRVDCDRMPRRWVMPRLTVCRLGDMLVQMGSSIKDNQNEGMVVDLLEDLLGEIE